MNRNAISMVCACLVATGAAAQTPNALPTVETDPVPSGGDAADDAAIWVHPTDPQQSLVIGTDKLAGLAVYDLAGTELQFLPDGRLNNVDVRYGFPLGSARVDIVAAGNRIDQTLAVYAVNPLTGELENVAAGPLSVGVNEAYGFCLYHSALTASYHAFVNDKNGNVEQWELFDNGNGQVDGALVRSFSVGSQTEGMVADDAAGWLYVGEETVGIWKYGAEPDAGADRVLVDSTGGGGHLTADVEGLAIYHAAGGRGYLLASSQGSSSFVVYDRRGGNSYLMTFEIEAGNGIDAVTGTDGIAVASMALGATFPTGMFVAQDTSNAPQNQNFKLVPWPDIADGGSLIVDTSWDVRRRAGDADEDGIVGIVDLLSVLGAWGPCPPASCPGDFNGDGAVGITDFEIVIANWG